MTSARRLDYLESLRGLAALVVVFSHYAIAFYPALYFGRQDLVRTTSSWELLLSGTPLNLLYNGDLSVSIFFVLSGFVLSYRFFQDRSAPVRLAALVVKRYVRLLPPILFSIGAAYLVMRTSLLYNREAAALSNSPWLGAFWQFTPSLPGMLKESFFGAFFGYRSLYNNVLWTMTYEFYGSLIVFAFLFLFRNNPRRVLAYLVLMLIFRRTYYLAFVLGILLSDWQSMPEHFSRKAGKRVLVAVLLAGLFIGSVPNELPLQGTVYAWLGMLARPRTWHIAGAFLIMTSVLHLPAVQVVLSKKPFVFLGRVSFSLYILHLLLISSLACFLQLFLAARMGYHAAFLVSFLVSLPVILTASYYTYIYIDRTGIELSQAVYRSLTGKEKRIRTATAVAGDESRR